MKQVKGSLFQVVAKWIRSNKSGIYNDLLLDKDWEVINSRILPSVWYPFENYKNCLNALIKVEAKGDLETCIKWGQIDVIDKMEGIYSHTIVKGDIKATLEKFSRIFNLMFNFSNIAVEIIGENEVNIIANDFDPDFEGFFYIARGYFEKFLELCLEKKIQSKFLKKSWEGEETTIFNFSWSY